MMKLSYRAQDVLCKLAHHLDVASADAASPQSDVATLTRHALKAQAMMASLLRRLTEDNRPKERHPQGGTSR